MKILKSKGIKSTFNEEQYHSSLRIWLSKNSSKDYDFYIMFDTSFGDMHWCGGTK